MTEPFKNQGGVSNSDPNPVRRWLTSKLMSRWAGPDYLCRQQAQFEQQRVKAGADHIIEYFHQVDDGYSHLSAQILSALAERYSIRLKCHLVRGPQGDNAPEPDLLLKLSRYDAAIVAPEYGLRFPDSNQAPDAALIAQAASILAAQNCERFIGCAAAVGEALWAGDVSAMEALDEEWGSASSERTEAALNEGTARRDELKHYSGAMFYFSGVWYWGIDRLYHLENQLRKMGFDNQPDQPLLIPRPDIDAGELRDNGSLTLEIYPSLRSPYTAIGFDQAVRLAHETGVKLVVRPVLPMVMRGVPATREKGIYIMSDAGRESRQMGNPLGKIYDPIGDPVRRAYSLYPWACEQGRGAEFISAFLNAAWCKGINTNKTSGLRQVVEMAGLDWQQSRQHLGEPGWEEILEANRLAMYEFGLWGVPSLRLLDENGEQLLALWGQDRIWLFAREIQRQLQRQLAQSG